MNIKAACVYILAIAPLSSYAAEPAGTCSHTNGATRCNLSSTGTINLSQTRSFGKTKNIQFTLNNNVKGVLKLHHSKANNKDTIKGVFLVDNTSTEKSYVQYRVVFKDKVGAVAQTKGELHLAKGKNQKMRFGSIVLTPEDMRNISTYDIQMVASNRKSR
jgi:hypothetical protein